MSTEQIIRTVKQMDDTVLKLFIGLHQRYQARKAAITLGAIGSYDLRNTASRESELEQIRKLNAGLIESAYANLPGIDIHYSRGGFEKKSGLYDEIKIVNSQNPQPLTELQRLDIVAYIVSLVPAFDPTRTVSSNSASEEQSQLIAIHNAALDRLEKLNTDLIEGSERFRQNLESNFQIRADSLETNFRNRSDKLEEDFRERLQKADNEIDKRKSALDERENFLNEKIKAVDDRANTHVRRELRKAILDEVKSRTTKFALTKGTADLRWPIHVFSIGLLVLLGIANYFFAVELTSLISSPDAPATSITILGIKQLVLSGAFGATAIFYLKWLNNWSAEHANAEFRLRQFQLDIERASWVVETALEWKDSKGSVIPHELLEPITRSLFSDTAQIVPTLHPADELASALLGTAAKVKLKAGESEIELDPRKLKRPSSQ